MKTHSIIMLCALSLGSANLVQANIFSDLKDKGEEAVDDVKHAGKKAIHKADKVSDKIIDYGFHDANKVAGAMTDIIVDTAGEVADQSSKKSAKSAANFLKDHKSTLQKAILVALIDGMPLDGIGAAVSKAIPAAEPIMGVVMHKAQGDLATIIDKNRKK